ncbi:MAG TPA: copper-binding protein [Blastocatellia bacterium]|nr:copper-binding protein [Blastocatellia bacterium]
MKGKVVSVDKRGQTVTVAHEAIPGYMEAMTMPFKLKDERLLGELAEGDNVQATLVVAGMRSWLEDVIVTREGADPSSLSKDQQQPEPKPGDEVPDFALVNQTGKRITFHQYRRRVLLVTFIYTRCPLPDYCPLMTDNFSAIEKSLSATPQSYAKTHFLSISVDPEYDTPKVLRDYAAAHSADLNHWEFAGGTKDQVKQIATYFGMRYWPDGDQIVHSLRTAIIGPDGKLVRLYHGNDWRPEQVATELRDAATPDEGGVSGDSSHGIGVVQSIDRENAVVQIDHGVIKDVMPAMNMPYKVKDNSLLDLIAVGDTIDFWVERTPSGLVVTRIVKQ